MQPATSEAATAPIKGALDPFFSLIGPKPFSRRLKIELTAHSFSVSAVLLNAAEVDKLIKMLEANKMLLADESPNSDLA